MFKLKLKRYNLPLAVAAGIGGAVVARKAVPQVIRMMGHMMGRMMEHMPDE